MEALRIVLDANVVVSALLRPGSAPGRILRAAAEGKSVRLVTSGALLSELRASLQYPRTHRYLKMSEQDREDLILLLEQIADLVSPAHHPVPGICRDPDDEPYLQPALAGHADRIVSGDSDLLDLAQVEHIPILSPAHFERILRRTRERR